MTVAEDHARVDHGREVCGHCAPAVALDVDEAQQNRVLDVLAGIVACISRHVLDQRKAGQWMLEELCTAPNQRSPTVLESLRLASIRQAIRCMGFSQ